jgi:drug/metabolite transporter (DMT)-like permease
LCSIIYGFLLDGWINTDALDSPKILAQSENLFALVAASVHALCAAGELRFKNSINLPTSQPKSIWYHKASLRSYVIYSTLEASGFLFLNWSLIFLDKHICAIFKSNKILLVLIGEVFLLNREMTGIDVASIIAVAVSMILLSLSELDDVARFSYAGIPLVLVGVVCAAAAPVLAKRYIFTKYKPPRTEVMFFHNFFTALFLAIGVLPQLIFLWTSHWFEQHVLGFMEMLILSVVSYMSHSLVFVLIDLFGPTNSELVECTSLVTSILFSYYFIASGTEFVFVHFLALVAFLGAFTLNVYGMSQQQKAQLRTKTEEILHQYEMSERSSLKKDDSEVQPFIDSKTSGGRMHSSSVLTSREKVSKDDLSIV